MYHLIQSAVMLMFASKINDNVDIIMVNFAKVRGQYLKQHSNHKSSK